ncbi:hypothetical protein [Streptomyces sp. NPDC001876]|uniref:hypothetical protein n=1 Tax=Streptomyces sp. NPDC001876 TaxID=3154402 RepID=UPI003331EA61
MPVHDDYYEGEHEIPLLPGVGKVRRHDVSIEMNGFEGRVSVGDEEIRGVRALTYQATVGERPVLELELVVQDVTRISSKDTEILLPNATVKTLIALGWTPPEGHSVDPKVKAMQDAINRMLERLAALGWTPPQVTDGDQTPGG